MSEFLATILAVLPEPSAINILLGCNAALVTGMGALYRDCRKDREKLWAHVRDLEHKIGRR